MAERLFYVPLITNDDDAAYGIDTGGGVIGAFTNRGLIEDGRYLLLQCCCRACRRHIHCTPDFKFVEWVRNGNEKEFKEGHKRKCSSSTQIFRRYSITYKLRRSFNNRLPTDKAGDVVDNADWEEGEAPTGQRRRGMCDRVRKWFDSEPDGDESNQHEHNSQNTTNSTMVVVGASSEIPYTTMPECSTTTKKTPAGTPKQTKKKSKTTKQTKSKPKTDKNPKPKKPTEGKKLSKNKNSTPKKSTEKKTKKASIQKTKNEDPQTPTGKLPTATPPQFVEPPIIPQTIDKENVNKKEASPGKVDTMELVAMIDNEIEARKAKSINASDTWTARSSRVLRKLVSARWKIAKVELDSPTAQTVFSSIHDDDKMEKIRNVRLSLLQLSKSSTTIPFEGNHKTMKPLCKLASTIARALKAVIAEPAGTKTAVADAYKFEYDEWLTQIHLHATRLAKDISIGTDVEVEALDEMHEDATLVIASSPSYKPRCCPLHKALMNGDM